MFQYYHLGKGWGQGTKIPLNVITTVTISDLDTESEATGAPDGESVEGSELIAEDRRPQRNFPIVLSWAPSPSPEAPVASQCTSPVQQHRQCTRRETMEQVRSDCAQARGLGL